MLFKYAVKGRNAVEARQHRGVGDGNIWVNQQRFYVCDPFAHQIVIKGGFGELLKQPAEVIFAESCNLGYLINGEIFGAVVIDIAADRHELIAVFQLFAGGAVGENGTRVHACAPERDKKADAVRIDAGFFKRPRTKIFFMDVGD